jgi:hypothetical protein
MKLPSAGFESAASASNQFIVSWLHIRRLELCKKMCKFGLFLEESASVPPGESFALIFVEGRGLESIWWLEWDLNPHGITPNGF